MKYVIGHAGFAEFFGLRTKLAKDTPTLDIALHWPAPRFRGGISVDLSTRFCLCWYDNITFSLIILGLGFRITYNKYGFWENLD